MRSGDLAIFAHIVVATALGFVVGSERGLRGQAAGDRTFALVSLGAAAFTALGVDAFPATAEKLIAGIVTGVGFIGAGLLLERGDGTLKGLTTAAAIWSVAAIGVLSGAGRIGLAALCCALVVLTLELRYVAGLRVLDARRWAQRLRRDE